MQWRRFRGVVCGMGLWAIVQGHSAFAQTESIYAPTFYHHASTLEEGAARGMADLVRSAGAANLLNSQAAINLEEARSRNFDNRLKWTQTYFEMRQANQEGRRALSGQRATSEQLFRLARSRAPQLLGPSELDPYSGEIRWPAILLGSDYAETRTAVDGLVRKRVSDSTAMNADERTALRAALDALAAQMQQNISAYPPQEYVAARRFLQSLAATTGAGTL